jgi:hypothetical protein
MRNIGRSRFPKDNGKFAFSENMNQRVGDTWQINSINKPRILHGLSLEQLSLKATELARVIAKHHGIQP